MKWFAIGSRPTWDEIAHQGCMVKALWFQWHTLTLKQGIIYRVTDEKTGKLVQLVIPGGDMRRAIFKLLHSSPMAGHLGQRRTIAAVRQRY